MDFMEALNKEELYVHVINELKSIGVKYRKEKRTKAVQDKTCGRRIFRTYLHLLELTDVILANGSVVQIPKFIADACNRILEQVEAEGIFRKAGSSIRQREIRVILETGMPLGKSHHVIDVANVIKYFFRELPEPLIPASLQETLLRSLLIGENHEKAIILACLLLPTLTINTLRFFMQFLYTVSLSERINKMTTQNLAIILTPGLMPFANINSLRFTNHLKVVQLLIENANSIGIVPKNIVYKLQMNPKALFSDVAMGTKSLSLSTPTLDSLDTNAKKKKKRRSGSLTQMFNGFKKIVGSTIGSYEDLEGTSLKKHMLGSEARITQADNIATTPCDKARKRRKFVEPMSAFSTKKRRELLALLPNNSGGLLPNTPLTKGSTKHRASLCENQQIENNNVNPLISSMERRWSIVGSGWSKNRNKLARGKNQHNAVSHSESVDISMINGVNQWKIKSVSTNEGELFGQSNDDQSTHRREVQILEKSEHQQVGKMDPVSVIRKHITHGDLKQNNRLQTTTCSTHSKENCCSLLGSLEGIQTQYERILKETASLSLINTKELPRHITRDLKIRRRSHQLDIRSPSARKIGSIRRRSQDIFSLRHTNNSIVINEERIRLKNASNKGHLKRHRQNILPICTLQGTPKNNYNHKSSFEINFSTENWMAGEYFFKNMTSNEEVIDDEYEVQIIKHVDHVMTPRNDISTFSIAKKSTSSPEALQRNERKAASTSKLPCVSRIATTKTMDDDVCGRASISRLRTKNAGMVMAKARLFDRLGGCNIGPEKDDCEDFLTSHQ